VSREPAAASTDEPPHRPLRALALVLGASFSFATLSAAIKACAAETGVSAPIFSRGVFGLLCCALVLRLRGVSLRPRAGKALAVRCLSGIAAMYCYYWAYTRGGTDLPSAVVLLKTAPVWVALIAPFALGESLRARIVFALGLGLAGMALRYGVSLQGEQAGLAASLAAGFLAAVAYVSLRALGKKDDPLVVVTWFSAFLILATLPGVALEARAPIADWTPRAWGLLALIGLLGTAGQLFLTAAYRDGKAAAVTIGGLGEVGIALAYSVLLFQQTPSAGALVGGGLALAAGVLANAPARRGEGADQAATAKG